MAFNFKEILTNLIIEDSRYDVLMKKYTEPKKKGKKAQMDKELLKTLMLADPTTKSEGANTADEDTREVEKVGAYTNWLIKQWLGLQQKADAEHDYGTPEWTQKLERLQELFMEDLYKVTEDLEKFHYLKKTKKYKGQKDIGQIKSVDDLYDNVKDYQVSKDEITKTKAERLRDDVDKVYEDDKWLILVPKSKEASCHYGGGQTRWCTASKSSNYYDHYAKQGPLYMMMYKEDAGKSPAENRSHQFHFESNSFYNAQDRSIDLGSFFATYPELKPFFKEKFATFMGKDYGKQVQLRYPNDTASKYISIYGFDEFFEALPETLERLDIEISNNRGYGQKDQKTPAFRLPDDITRFKNLEMLHIEGMLSELPDEVGELQNLQFISIPNNPNLVHIPESIVNLPNLEVLNVKNNSKMVIPHKIMEKAACGELVLIKTQPDKSFGVGECKNGQKVVVNYVDEQGDYKTAAEAEDSIQ
tara:strand:+ start:48 stop:1466 length:1419 start_codon:yes stop_codon:yes gene_type:complete